MKLNPKNIHDIVSARFNNVQLKILNDCNANNNAKSGCEMALCAWEHEKQYVGNGLTGPSFVEFANDNAAGRQV